MYRAEDPDPRARFEQARARLDATAAALKAKHTEVALLVGQVLQRGGSLVPIPELPKTSFAPLDPSTVPPAALAGLTAEIERAIAQLEACRGPLDATAAKLQAQLSGASVHATLGAAPRPVPAAYFLAEWLSWPFLVVALGGGAVAIVAGSAVRLLAWLPAVFVVGLLAWSLLVTARRTRLLGRGGLPVSTSVTTRPGFGSYQNQRMTGWNGWDPVATSYSGPRNINQVRFVASDGSAGELVVTGLAGVKGMILCEPGGAGGASRGLYVGRFHSRPRPDAEGRWSPSIGGAQTASVAIGGLLLLGAIASAVAVPLATGGSPNATPHRPAAPAHHGR